MPACTHTLVQTYKQMTNKRFKIGFCKSEFQSFEIIVI